MVGPLRAYRLEPCALPRGLPLADLRVPVATRARISLRTVQSLAQRASVLLCRSWLPPYRPTFARPLDACGRSGVQFPPTEHRSVITLRCGGPSMERW